MSAGPAALAPTAPFMLTALACTVEEIQEALYQSVAYCGLPAAIEAFRIAEDVLRERGVLPD